MNGIVVGIAMVVSSTGVSPAPEISRPVVSPSAFTLTLPAPIVAADPPERRLFAESHRPLWRTASSPRVQPAAAKRFALTERIIALGAGLAVGWVAGGTAGYKLTDNPSSPDDDMSGFRGAIVGAPIGATVGAILGWRLTDR